MKYHIQIANSEGDDFVNRVTRIYANAREGDCGQTVHAVIPDELARDDEFIVNLCRRLIQVAADRLAILAIPPF